MIAIAYSDRGEIPTELRFAKFEVALFGENAMPSLFKHFLISRNKPVAKQVSYTEHTHTHTHTHTHV